MIHHAVRQPGQPGGAGEAPEPSAPGFSTLHAMQVREVAARLKRRGGMVALGLTGLLVAILFDAGFPRWRVATVAALLLAPLAAMHMAARAHRQNSCARPWAGLPALSFAPVMAAMAVTGGMASPLLPLAFTGIIPIVYFGRSKESRALVGAFCVGAIVLASLPHGLTGPSLPYGHQVAALTVAVIVTVVRLYVSIVVLTDAYRRAGETLERTREDVLEQATSRGRELDCISAKLAHELKNPLAAIKALVQLMSKSPGSEEARARFAVISGEVARMEDLLRDYLSFSRPLGDLRLGPVDIARLADDAVAVVEAKAAAAGVDVKRRGTGPALVVADQQRLKEALLNLLSNALEATPSGGRVEVEVSPHKGQVDVIVKDTGRGIAPEHLGRVGSPFFTTRQDGTGLGVVLARAIVVQHQGSLCIESELGKGTVAKVTLPRLR